jgi:hypothetical protein
MHTTRYLAGAAGGVTALALIGGCAQQIQRLDPALELRGAARQLAAAPQAGFTLRLTGSADDLITGLTKAATDDEDLGDTAVLRKVLGSSVTVAYDRAGAGADDDRMLMAVTAGGVEGTELRVVDRTVYVKAPVTELARTFGAAAGDVASMRREAIAATPELGAFFDGRWVSLDIKDAAALPATGFGLPTADADTAKALAALRTGASNLFSRASVVRDRADARHLVVTTSTAQAYAEVKRLVAAVTPSGGLADDLGDAPKDRPIVLDLWIDRQKLSAVEVNLMQFVDGATGRAALRLDLTTGTPITAPADATAIDPAALGSLEGDAGDATEEAETLGSDVLDRAADAGGTPAASLREAIADLGPGVSARIVRRGVAELTAGGGTACLTLPARTSGTPDVTPGPCP